MLDDSEVEVVVLVLCVLTPEVEEVLLVLGVLVPEVSERVEVLTRVRVEEVVLEVADFSIAIVSETFPRAFAVHSM